MALLEDWDEKKTHILPKQNIFYDVSMVRRNGGTIKAIVGEGARFLEYYQYRIVQTSTVPYSVI